MEIRHFIDVVSWAVLQNGQGFLPLGHDLEIALPVEEAALPLVYARSAHVDIHIKITTRLRIPQFPVTFRALLAC